MITNPYILLSESLQDENKLSQSNSAFNCCLSTVNDLGLPDARIITIKEILTDHLIFTSNCKSNKVNDISKNNEVSLTFWLNLTQKQIKIKARIHIAEKKKSDELFKKRNKESRLISNIFDQRRSKKSFDEIQETFDKAQLKASEKDLTRPDHWLAFKVECYYFEFFNFAYNRLHKRLAMKKVENHWDTFYLEP